MFALLPFAVLLAFASPAPAEPLSEAEASAFARGVEAYRRDALADAWRIWLPLAEAGHADAQFALGMLCERDSVWVDCGRADALLWYERAARAGHKLAQFNLGNAYQRGRGIARDEALGTPGTATPAPTDEGEFTLQLGASPDAAGLRAFAERLALGDTARILGPLARPDGSSHFVLVWGRFRTAREAMAALSGLPSGADAWRPWPRRVPAQAPVSP